VLGYLEDYFIVISKTVLEANTRRESLRMLRLTASPSSTSVTGFV
jgi:hypothetical protein